MFITEIWSRNQIVRKFDPITILYTNVESISCAMPASFAKNGAATIGKLPSGYFSISPCRVYYPVKTLKEMFV